jgi:hypothetical protein
MEFLDNPFIYVEYTIAVILFTELLKMKTGLHAKWVSLVVGVVFGLLGVFLKLFILAEGVQVWKLLISFAVANVFYDYVLKVIYDRFGIKKN